MHKSITVCITSFNRFDHLKQTINSFLSLNKYPIERLIVIEDSANLDMKNNILNYYGNNIDLIFNEVRLGQVKSIDKAYKTITSEYIFHSEDDYLYEGNSDFIQHSLDILEENKNIHQIWIRHLDNYNITHGNNIMNEYILEPDLLHTASKISYRMIKSPCGGGWCGFSWNAGLRRTIDYQTMFLNGFDDCIKNNEIGSAAEYFCNEHALNQGYRAALLMNGACNDMGRDVGTHK